MINYYYYVMFVFFSTLLKEFSSERKINIFFSLKDRNSDPHEGRLVVRVSEHRRLSLTKTTGLASSMTVRTIRCVNFIRYEMRDIISEREVPLSCNIVVSKEIPRDRREGKNNNPPLKCDTLINNNAVESMNYAE